MSYEKQPTTTQDTRETTSWTITVGGREWTLEATRYIERDGSKSRPYWRIRESGDNRRDHDCDVNLDQPFDDEKPVTVGINWPAKGTQDLATTLKFKQDLGSAVQAATEAEYIIKRWRDTLREAADDAAEDERDRITDDSDELGCILQR